MCRKPKGFVLDAATVRRLRTLVEAVGEWEASRRLGVHPHSLARALAALPTYSSTHEQIATGLAELDDATVEPERGAA